MSLHQTDELSEGVPPASRREPSRRGFLTTAGVALPGLALAAASEAHGKSIVAQVHSLGVGPALTRVLIQEIRNDEAAHVTILQHLLDDEDNPLNPKIRPSPILNMAAIVQPNVNAFIRTAAAFENTGSGTYGGALFAIEQTDEYFPTAVGLCTVESRHASFLNALLTEPLVPNFATVESPIRQQVTLSRVAPFVTSPGPDGLPSFDPEHASEENNFRILDFLLFLEYIEAAFYRINVPRFFR